MSMQHPEKPGEEKKNSKVSFRDLKHLGASGKDRVQPCVQLAVSSRNTCRGMTLPCLGVCDTVACVVGHRFVLLSHQYMAADFMSITKIPAPGSAYTLFFFFFFLNFPRRLSSQSFDPAVAGSGLLIPRVYNEFNLCHIYPLVRQIPLSLCLAT